MVMGIDGCTKVGICTRTLLCWKRLLCKVFATIYLFIILIPFSIQGLRNVTEQNQGFILRLIWLVFVVASFIAAAICIKESIDGKVAGYIVG